MREFSESAKKDLVLIERIKLGDQRAYSLLMNKYRNSVGKLIFKLVKDKDDVDDLLMEVFTKVFMKIDSYKPDYNFSTWLFKIATNKSIDYIRKKRLKTTSIDTYNSFYEDSEERVGFDLIDESLSSHDKMVLSQRGEYIRKKIKLLPEKYQKLVELRYIQDKSYQEICNELGMNLGTLKGNLNTVKKKLYNLVNVNLI